MKYSPRQVSYNLADTIIPLRSDPVVPKMFQYVQSSISSVPNLQKNKIEVSATDIRSGQIWLRLLEHGNGPSIKITWPTDTSASRLFEVLKGCYGLTLAVNNGQGQLFSAVGQSGQPWDLNLDYYSGFMRQTSSWLFPEERSELRKINDLHGTIKGNPVRLLDRKFDARLLGGLSKIIGLEYSRATNIHATYTIHRWNLGVTNIVVDGRRVPGQIDLSPPMYCRKKGGT
jgi:hypothetical protein